MLFSSLAAFTVSASELSVISDAVIKLHPRIKRSQADKIATAVKEVYEDGTCTIPWQLVVSIAFHESSFRVNAVNKKTADYGFMQISKANVTRLGLDKRRLMVGYNYSLRAACKIISYNQSTYSHKVTYWLGMYRSGNALWKDNIKKNAIQYDSMIRNTAYKIGYRVAARRGTLSKR